MIFDFKIKGGFSLFGGEGGVGGKKLRRAALGVKILANIFGASDISASILRAYVS